MPRQHRTTHAKRLITATDLFRIKVLTSVSVSPDERKIAYTVEQIDPDNNRYFTNIYLHDLASDTSVQFTHGPNTDGKPAWSQDGSMLAFVSTRDKKTGLYVMSAAGGSERNIFEAEASIGEPIWHPDGKHIVIAVRYRDSHFITDERKKQDQPVFRHITRLGYRMDGLGFIPNDPWQVYVIDIESGRLRKVTGGKRDNHSPALSSDGRLIAFVSNRSKDPDLDSLRNDLFVIPFEGGRERLVPTPPGPVSGPKFSPDGKLIAYHGHDNPEDAWGVTNSHVWVVGVNGRRQAKDLVPMFDRMAWDQSLTDLEEAHERAVLYWSGDGKRVYFSSSDTGTTNLFYAPVNGGKPSRVFKGKCHVKNFGMNGKGRMVAFTYADFQTPSDLMTCPAVYGGEATAKKHTDLNPFLRKELQLGTTKDLMFESFDGTEVQGFLLLPPGFNPNKRYPSVLEIHGGPRTQYAYTFMHEMQLLAANGYVVFYTNPRGGSGRGETWAGTIAGGWGDLDYKDCMAAADYLCQQKYIDPKRIGVTGGSYGGYMTNWIVGHTSRFAAAITQRSVVDLDAFVGSSDIGYALAREFDGFPWENKANYEKCSPLEYLKNVRTPVLILHNEKDLRCAIEQAEQMFVKLKVLGKTVEFVRFPDEPHGLSRHGRPDRRIARLEWILRWFGKYLK